MRVYLRSAMGMPGSSEFLQELTSRVFGDFITERFLTVMADDLFVADNSKEEILRNYERALQRIAYQQRNCDFSAYNYNLGIALASGTLSPSKHKLSAVAIVQPPKTCSSMRSYIGSFKAISRCIPQYISLLLPLEDAIKGLEGS